MPTTNVPADYSLQAVALDFVIAFQKSDNQTKGNFAGAVLSAILSGQNGYDAIAANANSMFGINVSSDVLRRYIALIKTPVPNAAIGAFMKRVQTEPALKKQFLAASSSFDALQKVATANGLAVTALDLQNYLTPWQLFVSLLKDLLSRGIINTQQFQDHAGFAPNDGSLSGLGQDVDLSLAQAALSASGWATKLTPISDFSLPIGALIFPTTAVIIGGYEGQTFTFKQLGNMFAQGFEDALEGAAEQLEDFHNTLANIF
jgi:hypothetical protein